MAFLYTNNELSETEPRKKIPIKYLRINLTKEVKDLHLKNYKTLKKKLRKIQINGSTYPVHRSEELTSSKCAYYQSNL